MVAKVLKEPAMPFNISTVITALNTFFAIINWLFQHLCHHANSGLTRVEITSLLKNTSVLFNNREKATITFDLPATPIFILGDEQLLARIFQILY